MSKFGAYLTGYIIFAMGVALALFLVGVPPIWIATGLLALIGIGVFTGASKAKRDDPPATT